MDNLNFEIKLSKYFLFVLLLGVFLFLVFSFSSINVKAESIIADHTAAANFESIPDNYIDFIHNNYHIYYGHTSHGSQIISGLSTIEGENASYDPPVFHEVGDDLGHNGDVSWEPDIRQYLNNNLECNMVMMSWCGGCSDNTEEGINIYLNTFNQLELDYPDVTFIYMTGHLDGKGPEGNLYARNNQIRAYCINNDKVLFDFADVESWDPDGNYYPDDTDYCNWCTEWCKTHDCPDCGCAHSQCFNCYLKGKAWWWMMARISGWNGTGGDDDVPPLVYIRKPDQALYVNNRKIIDFFTTLVIGIIEVEVEATDCLSGVTQVSIYVDDELVANDMESPYTWLWSDRTFKVHTLKVIAYDGAGNFASTETTLLKIF